jgi:LacI family transcriptional regulator
MAITLKEVAKMAGVSPSTASHAIRGIHPGKRSLSAITIQRVREVAEQLGYRPNLLAAGLANNKTFTIGVMVGNLKGNFYERILKGVTEIIYPEYTGLLAIHNYQPERERKQLEYFLGKHVDGVIAAYSGHPQNLDIYNELQKQKMPLVLVDKRIENLESHLVTSDYYLSTYLAVEELAKLGHKNILFAMSGRKTENTDALIQGFYAAAEKLQLNSTVEIFKGDGLQSSENEINKLAVNVIDHIRTNSPQTTAMLVEKDWLAYDILAVCQEKGIKVPEDISMMGIEDSDPSRLRCIGLSSVRIELIEVGKQAADLLVKIINREQVEDKPIVIKPTVIMRKTTSGIN